MSDSIWTRIRRWLSAERASASQEICILTTTLDYDRGVALMKPDQAAQVAKAWSSRFLLEQIAAAVEVRKALAVAMTDEGLARYIGHLQGRYLATVGDAAYKRYAAGLPAVLTPRATADAECNTLLDRLKLAYSVLHLRNGYMTSIRKQFLGALAVEVVLLIVLLVGRIGRLDAWFYNFLIIALVGMIGSTVSLLRRSQSIAAAETFADDPFVQVSALSNGGLGLWVAMFSGAVFAIVLALVLMGGILNVQGITPEFCPSAPRSAACPAMRAQFSIFQRNFALRSAVDAAKMMFLCFLSGFAEQLVPDVLDRFTQTVSKR